MNRNIVCLLAIFAWTLFCYLAEAEDFTSDFFKIINVSYCQKPPQKGVASYLETRNPDKTIKERTFLPFLDVTVRTADQAAALNVYAKAYFYDDEKKLVSTAESPYPVNRGDGLIAAMPAFFPKEKKVDLCFTIPNELILRSDWSAVIVFGDKNGATATVYPRANLTVKSFEIPEQSKADNPVEGEREKVADPLIEHVVKTDIKEQPQITLFLRRPVGTKDFSETKGVLALCLLANSVGDVKQRLQQADMKDELTGVLRFAEDHKLAVLCWGSKSLWNPGANWDELKKKDIESIDHTFDEVAKAWAKGVEDLSRKYGIPNKNFLLWGVSGSAQYAARLALRQPQYFLAIHVHIPSSFDEPTLEANRILWCLSTGEDECGYDRSLKFLTACKKMGYPIIYKAIPGLGHSGHPIADKLDIAFFEYALSMQDEKTKFEA